MTVRGQRDGAGRDSGFGESDMPRDDRLRAALRYAPDADLGVPPQVAARIVAAAYRAAHDDDAVGRVPPAPIDRVLRFWSACFAASAWRLGGAGTVAAVMLVASFLWVGREELLTDESAPAADRVATQEPVPSPSLTDRSSMQAAVPAPSPSPSRAPAPGSGNAARDRAASMDHREPGPVPAPPTTPMPALAAAGQTRIASAPTRAAALAPATEPRQAADATTDRAEPKDEARKREAEAASVLALQGSPSAEATVRGLRLREAPRGDATASILARTAPFPAPPWRATPDSRLTWREPGGDVAIAFPPGWLDALAASIDRTSSTRGRSLRERAVTGTAGQRDTRRVGDADGPLLAVRKVVFINASGWPAGVLHLGHDAVSWCMSASATSAAVTALPSCEQAAADPAALARLKSTLRP